MKFLDQLSLRELFDALEETQKCVMFLRAYERKFPGKILPTGGQIALALLNNGVVSRRGKPISRYTAIRASNIIAKENNNGG